MVLVSSFCLWYKTVFFNPFAADPLPRTISYIFIKQQTNQIQNYKNIIINSLSLAPQPSLVMKF
jgi:hypothetical protein